MKSRRESGPGPMKTPVKPKKKLSRGARALEAMGVELPSAAKQQQAATPKSPSKSPTPPDIGVQATPSALPMHYSQLLRILESLLLVETSSKTKLSFSRAVQALGRMNTRMDIKQMGQLVHLCPELSWRNLPSGRDMAPRDRLVLVIDRSQSKNVVKSGSAIMEGARQKLRELAASAQGGEVPEVPSATIPDPTSISMNTPSRSMCTPSRSSARRLGSAVKSPASVRGPALMSTPNRPGRGVKRSLFVSPLPKVQGVKRHQGMTLTPVEECDEPDTQSVGEATPGQSMQLEEEDFRTPRNPRKRLSSLFDDDDLGSDIDMSPSATQTLRETMRQRNLMTPERVQGRKKGHALAILPETFDLVRAIFRRGNATRIPVQRVIEKMSQSQGGTKGPSEETLRLNLQQVLEHASQYMKLEHEARNNTALLTIDPSCNIKEIRDGLKQVAKNRDLLVEQEEAEDKNQEN